jgi:hypothetical protein
LLDNSIEQGAAVVAEGEGPVAVDLEPVARQTRLLFIIHLEDQSISQIRDPSVSQFDYLTKS